MLSRTRRQRLGDAAEARVDAAAKKRGWRLITANYQVRGGELDRVYQGPDSVIVVEVRYRSRADYGTAAASDMPTAAANNVGRTMARRKLIGYHQG